MKTLSNSSFVLRISCVSLLFVIFLVLAPLSGPYWQYVFCHFFTLSLFSLSFFLIYGMAGYLSFGHMAFYATGAYVTGRLMIEGVPLFPAVLLGALSGGIMAAILGSFCVRHTYIYFALLTLAFGMMVHAIVWKWTAVTGGDDGLIGIPRGSLAIPGIMSISLESLSRYYYFHAITTIIAVYAMYRICRSPFGLILNGIRDNAGRVKFAGVSTRRYLLYIFIIAGVFAGLAGALMAPLERTVSPAEAHWTKASEAMIVTLLGGPLSFWGPVIGAGVYIALKEVIVRFTSHWILVLGILLLSMVLGFRGGIVEFVQNCFRQWRRVKTERRMVK